MEFDKYNKFMARYPECPIATIMGIFDLVSAGIVKWSPEHGEYLMVSDIKKLGGGGAPLKQFSWITISPDKVKTGEIFYSQENIAKLINFCKCTEYLYDQVEWVVESGKNPNKPHLHIHILGICKNSKKYKQYLRAKWEQLCGFNINWKTDDYLLKQFHKHEDMPSYDDWLDEKIKYMDNGYKGTHANFEVIQGARGGTGVSTANLETL